MRSTSGALVSRTSSRMAFGVPRSLKVNRVGFPKQLELKMRFCTGVQFVIGAGNTGVPITEQFSVNGLFDPFTTGGGHKPMQFTQLSQLYNNYTVLRSKISVSFTPQAVGDATGVSQVPLVCGVYIEDNSTITPVTTAAVTEQSTATWFLMPWTSGYPAETISRKWDAKSVFGGDIRDNDDLGGSTTANPALQQYFTVFVSPTGTETKAVTINAYVTVEYDAVWDNLIAQAQNA